MRINRQDTNGVKPLLAVGELGYDNYPTGGDAGRVYVGTGSSNIAQAKKSEVVTVDGKVDTHVARIDNPHGVTKTQVGLSNVDNTADSLKVVASAGKWTTSRLINGTAVDGTTDVITSQWGTSRNITIGNTLKTVNGSGDVSWSLAEIGAIGTSSPAFTGIPTAPTAAVGTSNTVIATTEFVNAEIANDAIPRVVSTDNAIVRFDGTTGAVQNSSVLIDDNGNVVIGTTLDNDTRRIGFTTSTGGSSAIESVTIGVTNQCLVFKTTYAIESEKLRITGLGNVLVTGGGGLGYGTGSGGTVTQLTSKSTSVTLNKPTGVIAMHNAFLAAGESVSFQVNNSLVANSDTVSLQGLWSAVDPLNYRIESTRASVDNFTIRVTNISDSSLSEALIINFTVIKGANS